MTKVPSGEQAGGRDGKEIAATVTASRVADGSWPFGDASAPIQPAHKQNG
jgi:hypothetical protein